MLASCQGDHDLPIGLTPPGLHCSGAVAPGFSSFFWGRRLTGQGQMLRLGSFSSFCSLSWVCFLVRVLAAFGGSSFASKALTLAPARSMRHDRIDDFHVCDGTFACIETRNMMQQGIQYVLQRTTTWSSGASCGQAMADGRRPRGEANSPSVSCSRIEKKERKEEETKHRFIGHSLFRIGSVALGLIIHGI